MKLRLDSGLLCVTWWSLLVLPFRGRGPDGQSYWASGWRAPSAAGWCQCSCGGQCTVAGLRCFGLFRGNGVSLQLWKLAEVNAMSLQRLWKSSGGCCRLGIQGWDAGFPGSWASESWQASEVMYFILNSMLTSLLQVQRPCVERDQTLCSLVFQANVLFSQIIFMLLKVLHFQILYSISVFELFRVSDCYECLNLKVEQLIENRNIARFILEKVMWLLLVINY